MVSVGAAWSIWPHSGSLVSSFSGTDSMASQAPSNASARDAAAVATPTSPEPRSLTTFGSVSARIALRRQVVRRGERRSGQFPRGWQTSARSGTERSRPVHRHRTVANVLESVGVRHCPSFPVGGDPAEPDSRLSGLASTRSRSGRPSRRRMLVQPALSPQANATARWRHHGNLGPISEPRVVDSLLQTPPRKSPDSSVFDREDRRYCVLGNGGQRPPS
jgi:hypothetical protein